MKSRQGHALLRIGVVLLLFVSFEGFFIPYLASPRLGLSVHTLSALLGTPSFRIAYWCLIYSSLVIIAAYVLAAVWGAGNMTLRIAAGSARGTRFQELAILAVAYSSAPTGVVSFALILWGLRRAPE